MPRGWVRLAGSWLAGALLHRPLFHMLKEARATLGSGLLRPRFARQAGWSAPALCNVPHAERGEGNIGQRPAQQKTVVSNPHCTQPQTHPPTHPRTQPPMNPHTPGGYPHTPTQPHAQPLLDTPGRPATPFRECDRPSGRLCAGQSSLSPRCNPLPQSGSSRTLRGIGSLEVPLEPWLPHVVHHLCRLAPVGAAIALLAIACAVSTALPMPCGQVLSWLECEA